MEGSYLSSPFNVILLLFSWVPSGRRQKIHPFYCEFYTFLAMPSYPYVAAHTDEGTQLPVQGGSRAFPSLTVGTRPLKPTSIQPTS